MERFFLELDPPEEVMRCWPHVVVVGGGFAGLKICQELARQDVRVSLIDKRNFNLFQPLLYQVASGLVSAADVASPLRQLVGQPPNIQILLGEVVDIDVDAREVVLKDRRYGYDQLVVATGSASSYFGRDEWRPMAPPMKLLEHADEIRRRLLMALEEAEQSRDPERRRFLQTVVVVGAGPAGCELAGSLIELMHRAARLQAAQPGRLPGDPGGPGGAGAAHHGRTAVGRGWPLSGAGRRGTAPRLQGGGDRPRAGAARQ
jgi:NADH dehydrogenase